MTPTQNTSERKWLIKSSTKILGPFSLEEVSELLSTRQVSIIDEIRLPHGRWSYIRENHQFMDIIQGIRDQQDMASENTMTISVAHHSGTHRVDDLTLTPTPVHTKDEKNIVPLSPNMKDVKPIIGSSSSVVTKSYGASEDLRISEKLKRRSVFWRWTLILVSVVVVLCVAIILTIMNRKKNAGQEELLSKAIRYKTLGLYPESLAAYKKASANKQVDQESQIELAPVLIVEGRETLPGRRILEKALMRPDSSRADQVDAYLGIALSYIIEGDFKEADKALQRALAYEPTNVSVLLNVATIKLKKGLYKEALNDFEFLDKRDSSNLAKLGKAIASLELSYKTDDKSILRHSIEEIKESLQKDLNLKQELTLLMINSIYSLGDSEAANKAVVEFLSQDIGRSERFTHPLLVDWSIAQWDYLEKYCQDSRQRGFSSAEMKALRAVCLIQVNRVSEAEKLIQEALSENPKNPYVLIVQAHYLETVSRIPEAISILNMPELKSLVTHEHMLGDLCIDAHDVECAEQTFVPLAARRSRDIYAIYGLAWSAFKKKNTSKAYDHVRIGLEVEPLYIPLLKLRDKMESE